MKKWLIILIIFLLPFISYAWEKEYIESLEKGLNIEQNNTEGLGYTQSKNSILFDALEKALEEEAYSCEVLKIAVDMEYEAYFTIKYIYALGNELDIDQVCMCAVEAGIPPQIIARSAVDAVSPITEEPIYEMDEISQSQCLKGQTGLAYTDSQEIQIPLTIIETLNKANNPDNSFSAKSP